MGNWRAQRWAWVRKRWSLRQVASKERLFLFRTVMNERATVLVDRAAEKSVSSHLSERRVVVEVADDLSAKHPKVVHMPADGLGGKSR